jgi:hypothetical protein
MFNILSFFCKTNENILFKLAAVLDSLLLSSLRIIVNLAAAAQALGVERKSCHCKERGNPSGDCFVPCNDRLRAERRRAPRLCGRTQRPKFFF